MLLLQALGFAVGQAVLGLVALGAGGGFLVARGQNPGLWWALIPGFALLGLGGALLLQGPLGGVLFFLGLGAGFWAVFFLHREHWWAVIPGGVLTTLALVAFAEAVWPRVEAGGLLFLGLSLTFGFLYFLGHRWALWPALGVLVPLALALEPLRELWAYAFPLALVALGLYLIWRARPR
nr:hypothetical protein [Thermus arciformis]